MNPAATIAIAHLENEEENSDINLLLHQTVRKGDLITIRKDGSVLLNGREQPDATMELM
jgi:hypothetical protein